MSAAIIISTLPALEAFVRERVGEAIPSQIARAAGIIAGDDRAPLYGHDWADYLACIDLVETVLEDRLVLRATKAAAPADGHWPHIRRTEGSSHSRSVSTRLCLGGAQYDFIVGTTRHGGDPWPAPRTFYPSPLSLDEAQAKEVAKVVVALFRRYAEAYP